MLIKNIMIILIIILCSYAGFLFSEKYRKRHSQLEQLLQAMMELRNEITYTFTPLPEAFEIVASRAKEPLNQLLYNISRRLQNNEVNSVNEAAIASIDNESKKMSLSKEDFEIFLDLSKSMGVSGVEEHKKVFDLAIERVKVSIEKADKECEKFCKMYKSLGVSVGLMIAIFLY